VSGAALIRCGGDEAALATLERARTSARDLNAPVLAVWAEVAALRCRVRLLPEEAHPAAERARKHAHAVGLEVAPALAQALDAVPPPPRSQGAGADDPRRRTTLTCLGGFQLRHGSLTVDPAALRPRARELLFLLALHHGRDVHREVIIDALWREAPPDAGTHRLHVAASSVRRFLAASGCGDQPLQRHGDAYRLCLGCDHSDVQVFESRLREAARLRARGDLQAALAEWTRAVEAYAGDLLPEAGPAEWVVGDRERLRVAAASASIEAARAADRLGRVEHAIAMAQHAVELDPLRDTAWAMLADLQNAAGDPSAAAATQLQHGRVASMLDVRMNVPPEVLSRLRPPGFGAWRGPA
jgi:DNA-binding SARP family transcriptional activator